MRAFLFSPRIHELNNEKIREIVVDNYKENHFIQNKIQILWFVVYLPIRIYLI